MTVMGRISPVTVPRVEIVGIPLLQSVIALYKERVVTLNDLADAAEVFYIDVRPAQELLDSQLSAEAIPALQELAEGLKNVAWETAAIGALIKQTIGKHDLKMPKLAMPLRVMLTGKTHTPSVDAVMALFPRETVLTRLARYL